MSNELRPILLVRLGDSAQSNENPEQADDHAEDVHDEAEKDECDECRLSIAHVVFLAASGDDGWKRNAVVVARPPRVDGRALQGCGHVVGDGEGQVGRPGDMKGISRDSPGESGKRTIVL